jgi:hypothetical protein
MGTSRCTSGSRRTTCLATPPFSGLSTTWNSIVRFIGLDAAFKTISDGEASRLIAAGVAQQHEKWAHGAELSDTSLKLVRLQLESLGLIEIVSSSHALWWRLTGRGKALAVELQTAKSTK